VAESAVSHRLPITLVLAFSLLLVRCRRRLRTAALMAVLFLVTLALAAMRR
jgi:hypothetical protein